MKYLDAGHEVWIGVEHRAGRRTVPSSATTRESASPRPTRANLFAPLFRSTNEAALSGPGTGLGLGIVREIMHRHGGSIEVELSLGRGPTRRPAQTPARSCLGPAQGPDGRSGAQDVFPVAALLVEVDDHEGLQQLVEVACGGAQANGEVRRAARDQAGTSRV